MSWFTKAMGRVKRGISGAGNVIKKVPVVGKPIASVYNLGVAPVSLAVDLGSGTRVDHALVNHFRAQVKDIKTVAPYAQAVVSFVPGVGTGLSAAMTASLAIADGKKWDDVAIEAAAGAIPGGPVAQSAFKAATGVMQGKKLDAAAFAALPIPDAQKAALQTALAVAGRVGRGEKVTEKDFAAASAMLPPDMQKALQTGIAVGHAQRIQNAQEKVGVGGKAAPLVVYAKQTGKVGEVEGVAATDRILLAYNGKNGASAQERDYARETVALTRRLATGNGKDAIAARNGLTLFKKRAAAHRIAARFTVDERGYVRVKRV